MTTPQCPLHQMSCPACDRLVLSPKPQSVCWNMLWKRNSFDGAFRQKRLAPPGAKKKTARPSTRKAGASPRGEHSERPAKRSAPALPLEVLRCESAHSQRQTRLTSAGALATAGTLPRSEPAEWGLPGNVLSLLPLRCCELL